MKTVEEAAELIGAWCRPLPPRRVALADALGLVLAEPVKADLDLPPFDKALMDGYAVRSADCLAEGPIRLRIGEEIVAGRTATRPLAEGEAAVIMTGAPLPPGADAVVPHERTEASGDGFVTIPGPVGEGECRLLRGREMRSGDILFQPGERLEATKLGVLASVGMTRPLVTPRPRVAILPTGDEVIPADQTPGPGQIRESNATTLSALVRSRGGEPLLCPVARDEPDALNRSLLDALERDPDVLVLCGGVSAGSRDLVPEGLAYVGVRTIFHKVRLRPGKPLLFGVRGRQGEPPSADPGGALLVFGLPGNPVSGIVNFLRFVGPALDLLMGRGTGPLRAPTVQVKLAAPFRHRGERPTYHPARWDCSSSGSNGAILAHPLAWAGSADLLTVARADGFVAFPAGDRDYEAGEPLDFLPKRGDRQNTELAE